MATEKEVLKALTDKLVKVAKWPNQRKHFVVAWWGDDDNPESCSECQSLFYKDNPKMSNVEYVTLIHYYSWKIDYYSRKLERVKKHEAVQSIIDKCHEQLKQIGDKYDFYSASTFFYMQLYHYFRQIGDGGQAYECYRRCLLSLTKLPEGADEESLNEYVGLLEQRVDKQQIMDAVNDCNQYIIEQKKKWAEDGDYEKYVESVYQYVTSKENLFDEENWFVLIAILQINGIVNLPKRERSKKGSFDYNYAKAEKGDKEYQLLVAKAYREGDGVPKNIRLANLWEGFANNKIVE